MTVAAKHLVVRETPQSFDNRGQTVMFDAADRVMAFGW